MRLLDNSSKATGLGSSSTANKSIVGSKIIKRSGAFQFGVPAPQTNESLAQEAWNASQSAVDKFFED
jgi:hypothetical protein